MSWSVPIYFIIIFYKNTYTVLEPQKSILNLISLKLRFLVIIEMEDKSENIIILDSFSLFWQIYYKMIWKIRN